MSRCPLNISVGPPPAPAHVPRTFARPSSTCCHCRRGRSTRTRRATTPPRLLRAGEARRRDEPQREVDETVAVDHGFRPEPTLTATGTSKPALYGCCLEQLVETRPDLPAEPHRSAQARERADADRPLISPSQGLRLRSPPRREVHRLDRGPRAPPRRPRELVPRAANRRAGSRPVHPHAFPRQHRPQARRGSTPSQRAREGTSQTVSAARPRDSSTRSRRSRRPR